MAMIPARSLVALSVNIAIAAVCIPALADTTGTAAGANRPKSSSGSRSWPARIAGVIVGSVVGTPVCAIRKTIDEEKYGIQGMVGDTDNKLKKVAAGVFWLPFSVLLAPAESPICATVNAMRESDKPFSKSQFAISDCQKDAPKNDGP